MREKQSAKVGYSSMDIPESRFPDAPCHQRKVARAQVGGKTPAFQPPQAFVDYNKTLGKEGSDEQSGGVSLYM